VSRVQKSVIPRIEQRLQQQCDNVAEFCGGDDGSMSIEQVSLRALSVQREQEALQQDEHHVQTLQQDLLVLEEDLLLCISEVLQSFTFGKNADWDELYAQWLATRAETMGLKLRMLEAKCKSEMYTKESVVALRKLANQIHVAHQERQEELNQCQQLLQHYRNGGDALRQVADEYKEIRRQIQETKWELGEIKK